MVRREQITGITEEQAVNNLRAALGKGVLKIMSKMGISTVASYCGAQTFEAVGELAQEVVDQYFSGTHSPMGGVGLGTIAAETGQRRYRAPTRLTATTSDGATELEIGGEYQWRREGPAHLFNPETVFKLQHSTKTRPYDVVQAVHHRHSDHQSHNLLTPAGPDEVQPHPGTGPDQ